MGQLRLPRMLLALMVGGTLGLSGAVLQGYLRNPLADPGLLGVSGGAALGAVCVFYTGLFQIASALLPLGGLAGALVTATLLVALVGRGGALVLLLAGAAVSSFTAALTALVLNLVPSPYATFEIMHWLMGSLTDRTLNDVLLALPGVVVGCALLMGCGRALDALTMGRTWPKALVFGLVVLGACKCAWLWALHWLWALALRFLALSGLWGWWCRICCGLWRGIGHLGLWCQHFWAGLRFCWRQIWQCGLWPGAQNCSWVW